MIDVSEQQGRQPQLKERLHRFHTTFLMPGTLVREPFYWLVYKVMTCFCHYAMNLHTVCKKNSVAKVTLSSHCICVHKCVLKLLKRIFEGLVKCTTIPPVATKKNCSSKEKRGRKPSQKSQVITITH